MHRLTVATTQSIGLIARHHINDARGRRLINKGHVITAPDVALLLSHTIDTVDVVQYHADDIDEHTAAAMVAVRGSASGVIINTPHHGRVDIHAAYAGVLVVNDTHLAAWHTIDGVTIATRRSGRAVHPLQRVATIKILPFAMPRQQLLHTPPAVITVQPFIVSHVVVIIVAEPPVWDRLHRTHLRALYARFRTFPVHAVTVYHVAPTVADVTACLHRCADAQLIITLTETSIMDRSDVVPQSIITAGGIITCYGAPVEPGNLLLLGQIGRTMILGAPGCIRSLAPNVVDLLLPRLFAGVPTHAADVYAFANGGLLDAEE